MDATEEFVGIELVVPDFEGERKGTTKTTMRALIAGTARCSRSFEVRDYFLDDQLLSTPHQYFLYLTVPITQETADATHPR